MLKWLLITGLLFAQFALNAQHKRVEKGVASYYHDHLTAHKTANGEFYQPAEMTAAHLTLPFNTVVKVSNLSNNKSIIVRINDRGPFIENRIIDLSRAAADSLDMIYQGLAKVEVKVVSFGKNTKLSNETALASNIKLKAKKSKINNLKKTEKQEVDTAIILKENIASAIKIPMQVMSTIEVERNEDIDSTMISINERTTSEIEIPANKPKTIEVDKPDTYTSNVVSYGVQIGSFKKRSNMLKLSERLKKNFIEKFNVQEINKGDTLYYRMIIGEFENESSALRLKSRLEKEFPGCFVIKYNN
jgi:rare lipoprotein A